MTTGSPQDKRLQAARQLLALHLNAVQKGKPSNVLDEQLAKAKRILDAANAAHRGPSSSGAATGTPYGVLSKPSGMAAKRRPSRRLLH